ncbi:hypothetical protein Q5424_01165 [Conexibacter sp. JD483]|uniref:SNF2-related protein n=1 Tax=Conexibacter sp. JD483 TaxID=3064471 RepID=UPI00287022CB|nr:SNF2-related protein [Conexibacter sp. JD483]MDR9367668.1 hypothetical protein [Conexibacter sp. JD483]
MRVNRYFDANPDHILGDCVADRGVNGSPTLGVEHHGASISSDLRKALRSITAAPSPPDAVPDDESDHRDGRIVATSDGGFARMESGAYVPFEVPVKRRPELRALLQLRDDVRALLAKEAATTGDHPSLDQMRAGARARYKRYVAAYGPINRFTKRWTGHRDERGEPKMARIVPPVMRRLRSDPHAPLVAALEVFDEQTQKAVPAALLTRRTLHPRAAISTAETPADALAICIEQVGRVDLARIGSLLGVAPDAARDALGALVFEDPQDGELVPATEYLSGEVRSKLTAAIAAAAGDPRFTANVNALTEVQPVDLGAEEVHAQLGAGWIDAETHQEFLREILSDPGAQVESAGRGIWEVRGNRTSIAATQEWGTERVDATEIVRAIVEQRPIEVHDVTVDERRIFNAEETAAANEKADALRERFSEWVWESPERTTRLLRVYNDLYNAWVRRDYAADGERLTLPGLAEWFTPLSHQRTAVARMINEPAVGLFHCTGAGKTAEMVMGIMELRRLGMVSKPVVVVPNHMLEQFSREWIQLYPQTMLLAASTDDLTRARRRNFVARVATNDWDVVLMTRTGFERLPVQPETAAAYLEAEIAEMREMLAFAERSARLTVKRVEKAIARFEARVEELLDGEVDPAVTWEATGCDYVGCDEAHDYKNLHTTSHITDAAIEGSRRASDMHLKLDYLRRIHGNRVATFMTATPIANSVTEMHVMTRYLRPDLLQRLGLTAFDAWGAVFGQPVTKIEMAPSGGGNYRLKTRFASFKNAPELLSIFHVFADVKTAEQLQLPAPPLRERADGARLPETVVVPASPEVREYIAALGQRADAISKRQVTPAEDNMLKVSTDGRKAALDMRLVTGQPATGECKLDRVADNVAAIFHEHRDVTYRDTETGEISPQTGALQLVFCDMGTPGPTWNAYDHLRDLLVARGVPREMVRFIHDARTVEEKERLFAAARAGYVAVLIGSTSKMGVGTNVQARCIAGHDVDAPWRPDGVTQRFGRGGRRGNQNPEIRWYRYVVEASFDAYMWQTIERKQRFIDQIMSGRLDVREIEDIGDAALTFQEVKALASGDPLILEKASADAELARLERLERAYHRNQNALRRSHERLTIQEEDLARQIAGYEQALTVVTPTRGDAFEMTIGANRATARREAGEHVARWLRHHVSGLDERGWHHLGNLGVLGGLPIAAAVLLDGSETRAILRVDGCKLLPAERSMRVLDAGAAFYMIQQLENQIAQIPAAAEAARRSREQVVEEARQALAAIGQPFKNEERLAEARSRCTAVEQEMERDQRAANVAELAAVAAPRTSEAPAADAALAHAA